MKKLFYIGVLGIILYEIAKVYFIMPMPGSQRMNSIDIAYALHTWRWPIRIFCWLLVLIGGQAVFRAKGKWLPALALLAALGLTYAANFEMAADTMFYQPNQVVMAEAGASKVGGERLVIGVADRGDARAYPIQYIGYHHQVRDELAGKPIIVTYCTVCRTGRVFEPLVRGKAETFRLVGMDHFNAMFEDQTTGSWWRQANGEAIAGELKGEQLPEIPVIQTSLSEWLKLYPHSRIMQPDPEFQAKYDSMSVYEKGRGKSALTKTDTSSWKDKSWVVGLAEGGHYKAIDWNRLKKEKIVYTKVGTTPVVVISSGDGFYAFKRKNETDIFAFRNDTIQTSEGRYTLAGKNVSGTGGNLVSVRAYQEFWHSWQTFHPNTERY